MAIHKLVLDVEMIDGTIHRDITTTVADQFLFSKTARSQKWGNPQDDPLLYLNFLAFAALRRNGLFNGDFIQFTEQAAAVGEAGSEDVDFTSEEA